MFLKKIDEVSQGLLRYFGCISFTWLHTFRPSNQSYEQLVIGPTIYNMHNKNFTTMDTLSNHSTVSVNFLPSRAVDISWTYIVYRN